MSEAACECFEYQIEAAVDYCRKEWNMTYAEMIAMLEMYKHKMIHEAERDEDE